MKKKLIFTVIALFIVSIGFISCIWVNDYFYEQNLRKNIHKVKIGMSATEVSHILGEPTNIQMSDGPYYWCYSTNSFDSFLYPEPESRPSYMLLEMSSPHGYVSKIYDFDH